MNVHQLPFFTYHYIDYFVQLRRTAVFLRADIARVNRHSYKIDNLNGQAYLFELDCDLLPVCMYT